MELLGWYLLAINVFTFTIWGIDKWKAVQGRRRVSERTLLVMSLLGGWLGAYAGMSLFRHKTLKGSFLWKFWLIVALWIVGLIIYLNNYSA